MVLTREELQEINGGSIKYAIIMAIGGVLTFLIGVIDGYLRPLSCNK